MKSQSRTVQRGRQLLREQTPFKAILWNIPRDRQLEHYKVSQQHSISPCIADFACIANKLVVELDSRLHDLTVERDQNRDAALKEQGWCVAPLQSATDARPRKRCANNFAPTRIRIMKRTLCSSTLFSSGGPAHGVIKLAQASKIFGVTSLHSL